MNFLNRLSVAKKLAVAFGIALTLCLAVTVFCLGRMGELYNAMDQLSTNYMPSIRILATMDGRLNAMRRSEIRELAAEGNLDEFRAEKNRFDNFTAQLVETQKQYESMISSTEERAIYARFQEQLSGYLACVAEINRRQLAGDIAGAKSYSTKEGREVYNAISNTLQADIKLNNDQGMAFAARAAADYSRSRWMVFALLAITMLIELFSAVLITRSIALPLASAAEMLKKVAEGDLTGQMEIRSEDEIGAMAIAMNNTIQALGSLLTTVSDNATQLAAASEEISASAGHSSDAAQRQSEQTTQVATAMAEMSSTVVEVSNNSQRAADAAREASNTAAEGGKVVSETLATMRSIASSTTAVAERIGQLGKSSERIGAIAAVIDDIADQTNLLALNAAIEAARAGEQGRGFAVVADEVRKLAERTAAATKEIAGMIDSIQKEAREAVAAMQSGSAEVERGVSKTELSGKALDRIIEMAARVGEMVTQIATAATQQSATAEQVNSNVSNIAEMTSQASINAGETAKACTDLSNLAFNLQTVVGSFKLNQHTAPHIEGRSLKPRPAMPPMPVALAPLPPIDDNPVGFDLSLLQ